jgi:hypothetical protein
MTPFSINHCNASAVFADGVLRVSTGAVTRQWQLVDTGLLTTSLRDEASGREWISAPASAQPPCRADWVLNAITESNSGGVLRAIDATVVEDPLARDAYILVRAVFAYPAWKTEALYEVRAYPDAPGIWTRLSLRLTEPVDKMRLPGADVGSFAESYFLDTRSYARTAIGYYNDTQHRNHDDLTLLREECLPDFAKRQVIDWANMLCLEAEGAGLAVVKESHKCVNQPGVDTGAFIIKPDELWVSGLGLKSNNYAGGHWLRPGAEFRPCWAHWTILYTGGPLERQRAIKAFDRRRFPFIPQRDEKILENTWGTRGSWEGGAPLAAESHNVMREIASCADLGIDVVQIDHGWALDHNNSTATAPWSLCPEKYPDGWEPVVRCAREHGIELGLWFSWQAPVAKMIEHYRAAGLRRFKIDFINIQSRDDLDTINAKVDELIAGTDPLVGINWDATEEFARIGYFYGREHGNVFLENRENGPDGAIYMNHIRYIPRLCLRDFWELAHYMNLNQIQLNLQDPDRVERDVSNAWRHRMDYLFATTMMGVPLFFFETQLLSEPRRAEVKPLIATYKQHRDALHAGTVYPLGAEPDGRSWTGFQSVERDSRSGYLTLFREIDNPEPSQSIALHFLGAAQSLRLTNLMTGATTTAPVAPGGLVAFRIPQPGDYRFLRYVCV